MESFLPGACFSKVPKLFGPGACFSKVPKIFGPGACFSKVPKIFGPISGTTISFISSQRRGSKPSNYAILLIFHILKACRKISFSKQADCSLTTSFSGPKSVRDVRETGPCFGCINSCCMFAEVLTHQTSQSSKFFLL